MIKFAGKSPWVPLKYVGLPTFSYSYGKCGHSFKQCDEDEDESKGRVDLKYREWIRASPLWRNVKMSSVKEEGPSVAIKLFFCPEDKEFAGAEKVCDNEVVTSVVVNVREGVVQTILENSTIACLSLVLDIPVLIFPDVGLSKCANIVEDARMEGLDIDFVHGVEEKIRFCG
ncbi:hypothetical protein GH714_012194 [Hevea brasiliensis]|uniref:Zinc knuckle CX2CX4HX4C domain-containing protein n=1 Tax=Hevea brasiliensis TaxID=3981 RepID=A0A6A6NGN6_HEVBR|nr:hypothetical protein GH714_012194 [Hevea brasiliensis]